MLKTTWTAAEPWTPPTYQPAGDAAFSTQPNQTLAITTEGILQHLDPSSTNAATKEIFLPVDSAQPKLSNIQRIFPFEKHRSVLVSDYDGRVILLTSIQVRP